MTIYLTKQLLNPLGNLLGKSTSFKPVATGHHFFQTFKPTWHSLGGTFYWTLFCSEILLSCWFSSTEEKLQKSLFYKLHQHILTCNPGVKPHWIGVLGQVAIWSLLLSYFVHSLVAKVGCKEKCLMSIFIIH